MAEGRPGAMLFACNLNAVRSPMAEALVKRLYGLDIYVDSCGVDPQPELDPFAVAAVAELGCDLSHHRPKGFAALADTSFDLIVSLTPQAHAAAQAASRGKAIETDYWPTPDPTQAGGSREQVMDAYRAVRDHLRARITARLGPPQS